MPRYEIEQYEIHAQTFRVDALSEAEAVATLFNGGGDAVDDGLNFIEVADEIGLPVDNHQDLVEQLRQLDIDVGECVIPSIRSIHEIDD